MPKIKTASLIGAALDWAMAKCEKRRFEYRKGVPNIPGPCNDWTTHGEYESGLTRFSPATDWAQAGPVIDREGITVLRCDDEYGVDRRGFTTSKRIPVWAATTGQHGVETSTEHQHHDAMYQVYESEVAYGTTPLIAAMRCYVASKLGDEIEIPAELVPTT